ncbi:MAG TPA: hypothetical protein VGH27_27015 [Streptosporangiaceae bacterium]|jgi:Tol biopolymer transport system component
MSLMDSHLPGLQIYVMNLNGTGLHRLTNVASNAEPAWSPGGKQIAFQCDVNGDKQSNPDAFTQVWTMNADSSAVRSTGIQCSDIDCDPRWQPQ